MEAICAGVDVGKRPNNTAATPATWGAAIEVPEMVFVAVELPIQDEVMAEPGAKMSRQVPVFEKEDLASVMVVEPTVIALAARAGEELQALALLFPAATAITTPSLITFCTAASSAALAPPPRLMFATAGVPAVWWPTIQSSPAITPDHVPEP
jgi:hypothetical protein